MLVNNVSCAYKQAGCDVTWRELTEMSRTPLNPFSLRFRWILDLEPSRTGLITWHRLILTVKMLKNSDDLSACVSSQTKQCLCGPALSYLGLVTLRWPCGWSPDSQGHMTWPCECRGSPVLTRVRLERRKERSPRPRGDSTVACGRVLCVQSFHADASCSRCVDSFPRFDLKAFQCFSSENHGFPEQVHFCMIAVLGIL